MKRILHALLAVLLTVTAFAQNNLDKAGLSGLQSQAAYSTRKLSSSYNGLALRVRRADNALADVAFDANGGVSGTSTVTLVSGGSTMSFASFYSGTSCYVQTWYDQSGKGRNAVQATASSQPAIINNGTPYTFNGRFSLNFDGSSDELNIASFPATDINSAGTFSTVMSQPTLQAGFSSLIAWGSSASPYGPAFGPLDNAANGKFG